MFIVLAYDIPNDKRRTRLHKSLKRFGHAVQESVFEFHLDAAQLLRLKEFVNRAIDPDTDEVRLYFICESCRRQTEATSPSRMTDDPFVFIV